VARKREPVQVVRRVSPIWIYIALLAAIIAVYSQVATHEFLNYDDPDYVTANTHVQSGFTVAGFTWAFTSLHAANWIPLTWLSCMLDCQLFGLRPGQHHLMSVAIHAISTLLLYAFLWRATSALWRSAFVAFAFALHPLHIESVAWLAERKDVLSALFWMLTLLAYLKYTERKSLGRYAVVVFAVACALMAKPMAITLPVALLLLDLWPLRRFERERPVSLVIEKLPLVALAIGSATVTYLAQAGGGAISGVDQIPVLDRLSNALASYFIYLLKFAWPSNLAVFYPYPDSPQWALAAAGILTLAGFTTIAIRQFRARPYLTVGWLWYSITLIPVIGLVQVGLQAYADRYMYLPMIGLLIAIAWSLRDWFERRGWNQKALAASAAIVCVTWSIVTYVDLDYWRNSVTLFEHTIQATDRNFIAYNNLGNAYADQGRSADALSNFQNAAAIRPQAPDIQENLGVALTALGRAEEAQPHLEQAIRIDPNFTRAHIHLALALMRQGKIADATNHYVTALQHEPDNPEAHYGLGGILAQQGRMKEALPHFQEGIRYLLGKITANPDSVEDRYNLGTIYGMMGRASDAIAQFSEVIRLRPDDAGARFNLGTALMSQNREREAADQFAMVVRLRPGYANGHLSLARSLASMGRVDEAASEYKETLRLDPNSVEARDRLRLLTGRAK
jgi:tetratricopeptide (TPR) repeat protein